MPTIIDRTVFRTIISIETIGMRNICYKVLVNFSMISMLAVDRSPLLLIFHGYCGNAAEVVKRCTCGDCCRQRCS